MKQGIVVILSGVSSVGKGDIRDLLLADKDLKLFYSVSETTRPQKEGEVDGVDYYFISMLKLFIELCGNLSVVHHITML